MARLRRAGNGRDNERRSCVQPLWEAEDKEAYIQNRMEHELTANGKHLTRGTAARWYNLMTEIAQTSDDILIRRDSDDLWWTTSLSDPPTFECKIAGITGGGEVVVCHKQCLPWSKMAK